MERKELKTTDIINEDEIIDDYATETEGNTEFEDDVGDLGDVVVEAEVGGQTEQLRQNIDGSEMSEGGEEHISLQFVPEEDDGSSAPRINGNYNIENLPNEVLVKSLK